MTLRRVGLSNSLSSQAKISNKRFTLSRVSLRRFPFPTAAAAAAIPVYIEDVFSTYLYTGNGSTQTITNGIDLSTKGGLVWIKSRSAAYFHSLTDTARGAANAIYTNSTFAQNGDGNSAVNPFLSSGFTLNSANLNENQSGQTYASWTFREQAKFFDVVTYTGNGTYPRNISHNLGSTPGCIIVKKLSSISDWFVYHRSLSVDGTFGPYRILLNTTAAQSVNDDWKNAPTSTQFTVNNSDTNGNGVTYVAYLFAHDAGGFGATGSDNVISCGSFTTDGSGNATVNLGYEPQWVMLKRTSSTGDWYMFDNMRGMPVGGVDNYLLANRSDAENPFGVSDWINPNATGFSMNSFSVSSTFIYIAIRRGPMKTPTSGTDVFSLASYTGNGSSGLGLNSGIVSDAYLVKRRTGATSGWKWMQRLISYPLIGSYGPPTALDSTTTAAESAAATWSFSRNQNYNTDYFEVAQDGAGNWFVNGSTYINYALRRAPGFFDVVCYTGTGSYPFTINHNLAVVPELMIFKSRNNAEDWWTIAQPITSPDADWYQNYLTLNSTAAASPDTSSFTTAPTSTTITASSYYGANGNQFVLYLFASCPGVSKVGSYTGTGALQTINCGFTSGARFVLIKRVDSTGSWFVYDSARGITSGNDPYLLLNSNGIEATSNWVDTISTGFQVTAAAPAELNANGGTYIFLAIA